MFDLFRRRQRSDVSLVTEVLAAIRSTRIAGAPIPVDQLPVAIGIVNLYADLLASLSFEPADSGRRNRVTTMLDRPNPDEPRFYTVHKLVQSAFWTGDGHAYRDGDALVVTDPNRTQAEIDPTDNLTIVRWMLDGFPVDVDDIIHLRVNDDPRKGPLGRSPLSMAAEPLEMYGFAYRYLADFFAGGGNPSSVLQRTGVGNTTYTNAEAAKDWIEARQERRPAVLPAGWEFSVPTNNGELEAIGRILEHSATEVARLTNTPPSLVNARSNGSMTYSTVAGEFRRWLAVSLKPAWICRLELFFSEFVDEDVVANTDSLFDLVDPTTESAPPPAVETPALRAVS